MNTKTNYIQKEVGVDPPPTVALDPRQERYIDLYLNADSDTFGNSYQSAKKAGYTVETARNLTHNRPKWLSEKLGQIQKIEPDLLVLKLTNIINSPNVITRDKLKAIDMLMKHYKMFNTGTNFNTQINIQSVLD